MFTLKCLHVLRWAALGLWGALMLSLLTGETPPGGFWLHTPAALACAAYLLSFWRATDSTASYRVRRRWTVGLSLCALALHGLFPLHPLAGAPLVAVAGVLPMHLRLGPALAWVGVQTALLLVILGGRLGGPAALEDFAWSLGLQAGLALGMFAVFHHLHLRREWFNLAAHLQRQAREAERVQIARDLHDVLGHDLALLGVELEHARRFGDDEAVRRARAIVSRLFEDVRGTVGSLRSAARGWGEVLRPLDVSVPGLRVHVSLPPSTPVPESAALGALAMVVQEALTNTVRHAGATNFFVEVCLEEDRVTVRMQDDGKARQPLVPGHGLTGMRERLADVGGSLTVGTLAPGNVQVQASVPLAEGWR
ncbi:sensor histidine kinase [Deinococcus planocerae]|uniref:sensor histidine kinase n=1 Tax=Deinococcus planocerae TaxID=1737569 RepID=UPI000C7F7729|nr:histidine kinase [Deinococcus planocerae]